MRTRAGATPTAQARPCARSDFSAPGRLLRARAPLALTLAPAHKESSSPGPQRMLKCDRPPGLRRKSRYLDIAHAHTRPRNATARARLRARFDPSALGLLTLALAQKPSPREPLRMRTFALHRSLHKRDPARASLCALGFFSARSLARSHSRACSREAERSSATAHAHTRPTAARAAPRLPMCISDPARGLITALRGFSPRARSLALTLAPAQKEPSALFFFFPLFASPRRPASQQQL